MEACPICGLEIATSNLPDHASAHFADDTSAKGSSCPVCSLTLPVEELDGHLLAHRLTDGWLFIQGYLLRRAFIETFRLFSLEDTQAGPSAKTATLAEELKAQAAAIEEEEFAKLQAKYGMAVRKVRSCICSAATSGVARWPIDSASRLRRGRVSAFSVKRRATGRETA